MERNVAWKTGERIEDPDRKEHRALDVASARAVFALIEAASARTRPGAEEPEDVRGHPGNPPGTAGVGRAAGLRSRGRAWRRR